MAVKYRRKNFSILKLVKLVSGRLFEHEIITYSAALAFYMLLSIIPLTFIGMAVIGEIIGENRDAAIQWLKWTTEVLPFIAGRMEESIYGLIEKKGFLGSIGILSLLWTAHMVLAEGEKVIRKIFGVEKKRWLAFSYIIAWGIFLLSIIFFTVSFLLGLFLKLIRDNLLPHVFVTLLSPFIESFLVRYAPPVMVAITVTAAYKFLPQRKVPISLAFAGGISFAILWEIAKKLFFIYMGSVSYLNLIYGSLGTLMMFLLFVFYSALLFIFIAEVLTGILDVRK
ncbi:MAG: YihY/virulence factor BrkB family protein [Deltaproteobacteria bacterium]|nr:YihY/virulence factor BrkB family protein [Deltaproteobacteria bacterium]